jgi:heavy metal sensor kinase
MNSKWYSKVTLKQKIIFLFATFVFVVFFFILLLTDVILIQINSESGLLDNIINNWYIVLPVLLVLSILSGLLVGKLTMKPIRNIVSQFEHILKENPQKRLNGIASDDEIGQLQHHLNKLLDRLENSLDQIRRFSSDVSHEMRTPLTILQGELEIALNNQQTPEDYEYVLTSALEEVHRISHLVGSLLELSRADTGQLIIRPEKMNLSNILSEISEDAEIMAEEKGIASNRNIERNIFAEIDADTISRALHNIIDNAIKYTPNGGNISISLSRVKSRARICIADDGIGIAEDDVKFIFDRLYKVDKSRAYHPSSAGLGLSIVKWIIDAHNGSIIVNSKLDKGTEFVIELPAIPKSENNKLDLILF